MQSMLFCDDRSLLEMSVGECFCSGSRAVEDHLVRLYRLWKREDNCTKCTNDFHFLHIIVQILKGQF